MSKASLRLRQLRDQARCSPQDQDTENLSLSRDLPSLGQGQRHSITTVTATIISQRIHAQCQKVMNIDKKNNVPSRVSIQNRSTRQSAMRVIGTARIICGAGSMELSSVHPSVCLSYLAAVTAGLLL